MKKNRNFLILLVLTLFTMFASLTCKVALGGTVDILPPKGEISYPDAGETPIRGSFVLKGWAKDDGGIKAVSVIFENTETKVKTKTFNATLVPTEGGAVEWEVAVNNESTGTLDGHPLVKVYPIPDGQYEAIITITDKGDKLSKLKKTYTIDNTPPVFIVSRPSTVAGKDDMPDTADAYGAFFRVVGQVGEKNLVEKLNIVVPDTDINIQKMFVSNNINVEAAAYSENPPNSLYALQASDISKALKAQMFLYDNAREFKGTISQSQGNKAEWYYLNDEIYLDVLQKGYTAEVINDYLAGKDGSGNDERSKKIKALREDQNALNTLKAAMIKMDEKRSTFKLDPSKAPGFKVLGIKNLTKPALNLADASSILFKNEVETSFIVELLRNKDKTPLVRGNTLADYKNSNIEIFLLKWNGTGDQTESFKNGENLDELTPLIKFSTLTSTESISVAGESLHIKCKLPTPFEEGKYLLRVRGTDMSGAPSNTFAAYDDSNFANDGLYIINFLATGAGPRIRPIRIEGYKKDTFKVEADITGLDATAKVYYNIDSPVSGTAPIQTQVLKNLNSLRPERYEAMIDVSSLSDGPHEIYFLAKNGNSSGEDAINTGFSIDKTGPEVKMNFPDPGDPQAGEITISGTINDIYAGVNEDKTKWIIGKRSPVPTADNTSIGGPNGWQDMVMSTKGSWNFKYNFDNMMASPLTYGELDSGTGYYKIPVYILSEDLIGNSQVHTLQVLFDKDGKKPVVKVLSPADGAKLGGTIQIFGIASAPKGGPAAVGKVYIQFSKSGNFTGGDDGTFGTNSGSYVADWYQGGRGQLVPGTDTSGGGDWRLEINGNEAFNGPNQTQDVYYRLRAVNRDNTEGGWTEKRKMIVDKDAPVISDINITNISGPASSESYQLNMWVGNGKKLNAKLSDPSGLKEVELSSAYLNGGFSYKLSEGNIPSGWLTKDLSDSTTHPPFKEYNLSIPIDLSQIPAAADGKFELKIAITEATGNNLRTENNLVFRFDTDTPSGSFGEYIHMNNANFSLSSINDAGLASAITSASSGSPYEDVGLLIKNKVVKITGVSGSQITFTPSLAASGVYNYILYKKQTLIFNKSGANSWILHGVADDEGAGIKEVRAKVSVGGVFSGEVIMTETDPTNRISKQLGGHVTWSGKIDLSSLSDGKGQLHYQIMDKSGNAYNVGSAYGGSEPAIDVVVKNKPIKVSNVTLKTKIGGSDVSFVNTNVNNAMTNINFDGERNFSADYASTDFAFKDKSYSKIKVDFTGGEGQIKYKLLYNSNPLTGHNLVNIPSNHEITLSEADLNTIGNSNGSVKELILELWDSAHGLGAGTDSANAKIKIKTLFDALDTKPPVAVMLPFHWNSEMDNSLYQNSRANGHVEIGDVAGLSAGSSVSGKVTVRGFAYDNIQLNTLTVTLPNTTPLTVTATRTANTTNWTSDKNMAANGAELLIEETKYDYLGYYVKWKLEWDTEKADVGTGKSISVSAHDGINPSGTSAADPSGQTTGVSRTYDTAEHSDFADAKPGQFILFTKGEAQHLTRVKSVTGNKIELMNAVDTGFVTAVLYKYTTNVPAMGVNVLPYITEIETALKPSDGSFKGAFSRASTGEYPVRAGETITIKGFNLKKGKVYLGTNPTSLGTFPDDKNTVAVAVSNTYTTGDLKVSVGSVDSINNLVDVAKPYNIEGNGINNDILNARRKLFVWKMTPIINNSAMESPQFVMDSKSNYYLVFGNLKSIGTSSDAMRLSTKINGTQLDTWEVSYSKFHNTIIGYDTNGKPYLASTNTDRASNSTSFTFCFQAPSGNSNYDVGKNKTRLENCDNQQTNVYDVNRAQIPKMAVKGGGTSSDPAKIALVYFDKNVKDDAPLKFRYGTVTGTESWTGTVPNPRIAVTGGIAVNVYSNGGGSDPSGPSSGSAVGYEIVANSSSLVAKAGQYAGVALTASNRAIVVWYDAEKSKLMYSFRDLGNSYTAPAAGGDRKTVEWQANAVEIDGGAPLYVDIALDDEENLHIGYYSSSLGGVKYAYLPKDKVTGGSKPAKADFKLAVVDTFMNPGTYLKIGVRKESGKQVPYITYYHNGFYGSANAARIAWLKEGVASGGSIKTGVNNDGKFTGDWTVMTVPASGGIQQYTICQGVPTSGNYGNKVIAAYFTNKNYEMAVLEK